MRDFFKKKWQKVGKFVKQNYLRVLFAVVMAVGAIVCLIAKVPILACGFSVGLGGGIHSLVRKREV